MSEGGPFDGGVGIPEGGYERAQAEPFWELVLLVVLGMLIVYAAGAIL